MSPSTRTPEPPRTTGLDSVGGFLARPVVAGALIVLAGWAVYHNSLGGPFVFDDVPAIVENPTIRNLGAPGQVLSPPSSSGFTVSGRPVLNLSFAIDRALHGVEPRGFHVTNLVLHIGAALVLFGLVRRSLVGRSAGAIGAASLVAVVSALVWVVHPLTTAAVTYVVQRAEVLAALFYLLTLYGLARGICPPVGLDNVSSLTRGRGDNRERTAKSPWLLFSVVACWLGAATKEILVTAPLVALLYDRAFHSETFGAALRARRGYYLALAASWALTAILLQSTGGRGGTVGLSSPVSPLEYLQTQLWAVPHYFRLALWPDPLVFDYGTRLQVSTAGVATGAIVLVALVIGLAVAWRRSAAAAFPLAAGLLVLLPTSSVVPVASQVAAEHRMYLPLAGVVVMAVLGLHALGQRRTVLLGLLVVVPLGLVTVARNRDYASALSLWGDTSAKLPENGRARYNHGLALIDKGDVAAARAEFEAVVRLQPRDAEAFNKLGNVLLLLDDVAEATAQFERAIAIDPAFLDAHNNLGVARARTGDAAGAARAFSAAVALRPDSFESHVNLANSLLQLNRIDDAARHYETAGQLRPDHPHPVEMLRRIRAWNETPRK